LAALRDRPILEVCQEQLSSNVNAQVVCKDCNKTVSDLTWKELEAQGWDVAVPMWAQSREGLGKEGYYVKYPQHRNMTTDRCPECNQKYMRSPELRTLVNSA
jgi:uncharacterized protein with PIN domain